MKNLRLAIKAILDKAEHYEWSLQGFGMLRLYLSREVRLHVWSPRHAVENVSVIHDHPWDFESLVICGRIRDVLYEDEHGPPTHHEHRILCGVGGHPVGDRMDARLLTRLDTTYFTGQSYRRTAEQLHETSASEGAVTLVTRSFRSDPDHARVLFPFGTEWVSAEPRPATRDEVGAITVAALNQMTDEETTWCSE